MARLALLLSGMVAVGAFGVVGLSLALAAVGVPFIASIAAAALLAGLAAFAALSALVVRPFAPLGPGRPAAMVERAVRQRARLGALEAATSSLRHDLRGLLSPAVLVTDRLVAHPDPKVVKAGETVLRAIGRATDRLADTREPASAEEPQPGGGAASEQHDRFLAEAAAQNLNPSHRS